MALTSFFRDQHTLDMIAAHVIPSLRWKPPIRIWDAGCASGEEPFTIAMLFAEYIDKASFLNLRIEATDQEEASTPLFGRLIREGIFSQNEAMWVPQAIFEKHFRAIDRPDYYQISQTIRDRVHYTRHDLRCLEPVGFDFGLIVCKNVLMHVEPDERIEVVRMFHRALMPGGFVAFEPTQPMPPEVGPLFEAVEKNASVYRKIAE